MTNRARKAPGAKEGAQDGHQLHEGVEEQHQHDVKMQATPVAMARAKLAQFAIASASPTVVLMMPGGSWATVGRRARAFARHRARGHSARSRS